MTVSHRPTLALLGCLAVLAALAGCSAMDNFLGGDKVDYRSVGTQRSQGLEVPPDLTQLSRDTRYQQPGATVSAAEFQAGAASAVPAATSSTVAPKVVGDMRIERAGNERWLVVPLAAEQLWPQLQAFWKERGFTLAVDDPRAGVMETDWAENRAKIPQDIIRRTIGKVLDQAYSTSERDKFRTRVERGVNGSEIYVSHRGMVEVYTGERQETTKWQPRPVDPKLEAEMLQRLMLRLGAPEEQAKAPATGATTTATAAATTAPAGPARARIVEGRPAATLDLDDNFDRAWRRVGLALDRGGFTVEDRDRAQGLYFVRYVDPAQAGKEEPGFLSRLFSFGRKKDEGGGPVRYRVALKGEGERTTVSVLNAQGQPEGGDVGKRIIRLLVEDLK